MTEHVEKISPSVMRALRAVERGEVFRLIQNSSSKMQGPMGIGPIQFWRCQWAKLIELAPHRRRGPLPAGPDRDRQARRVHRSF